MSKGGWRETGLLPVHLGGRGAAGARMARGEPHPSRGGVPHRQGGDGAVWHAAVGSCGVRIDGTEGVTTERAEGAEESRNAYGARARVGFGLSAAPRGLRPARELVHAGEGRAVHQAPPAHVEDLPAGRIAGNPSVDAGNHKRRRASGHRNAAAASRRHGNTSARRRSALRRRVFAWAFFVGLPAATISKGPQRRQDAKKRGAAEAKELEG